ncbi:hypothetical protein JW960_16430 [candidate division KSB1 bacterium]|nr:hypothetical protein [candidate division KSB1 bacterium]
MKIESRTLPVTIFSLTALLLILTEAVHSQPFIRDSLCITLNHDKTANSIAMHIDSVIDERDEAPHVLARDEIIKYSFIPLDLVIYTQRTLADAIYESLSHSPTADTFRSLTLGITQFKLTKVTSTLIYPHYQVNAAINLYQRDATGERHCAGQLLYETMIRAPIFKNNYKTGLERVIAKWQQEFRADLSSDVLSDFCALDNFRTCGYSGRPANLMITTNAAIGTFGETADLQLYFSNREARPWFYRSGGYNVRYRNADDFESIEFGLSNDYLNYRFHPNWVFQGKSLIMIGFNRWKDINVKKHKLYDAMIADYSLGQLIQFNPFDRSSLVCGFGLQQDVMYIYSKGIQINVAIQFQAGIKL